MSKAQKIRTPFGTVTRWNIPGTGLRLSATRSQLYGWANRPGERWPCSKLQELPGGWVYIDFQGDLVDLSPGWFKGEIDVHELNAWVDDVCNAAGIDCHL